MMRNPRDSGALEAVCLVATLLVLIFAAGAVADRSLKHVSIVCQEGC